MFDRLAYVAGTAVSRASAFTRAWTRDDVDAVLAVRGGYGSVEILPLLDRALIDARSTALVGYSDLTSMHVFLNGHLGMASVHGADDRRPAGARARGLRSRTRCSAASAPSRSAR